MLEEVTITASSFSFFIMYDVTLLPKLEVEDTALDLASGFCGLCWTKRVWSEE
jgi:hypothetical protein